MPVTSHINASSLLAPWLINDGYIVVKDAPTDVLRGANMKVAYTASKSLTPGGNALSATNRAALIVPAGRYDFGAVAIDKDAEFIDWYGVGECRLSEDGTIRFPDTVLIVDTDTEVVNDTTRDSHMTGFLLIQETDNALNRGLVIDNVNAADRSRYIDIGVTMPGVTRKAIDDGTNTDIGSYFENCHTLAVNLVVGTISGTCIDCTGAGNSFAGFGGSISGTCTNCVGGDNCFASGGTASGTFNNCASTGGSFGGTGGTASGTFNNCDGGINSFAGGGTFSGVATECTGLAGSFGGGGNSGTAARMTRCRSTGRRPGTRRLP